MSSSINQHSNSISSNNVAIVWYHKTGASHVGISIDDKPYGFARCCPTIEPSSLEKSIKWVNEGMGRKCNSITVQYLKISPQQRLEIEEICKRRFFPCITCMDAISRILNKVVGIQIPYPINQLPDTSLTYLKSLQQSGMKNLSEQITYGKVRQWEQVFRDMSNRLFLAISISCIGSVISEAYDINTVIPFISLSISVLYGIHLLFLKKLKL